MDEKDGPEPEMYSARRSARPLMRAVSQWSADMFQMNASDSHPPDCALSMSRDSSSWVTGGSCIWSPNMATGTPFVKRDSAWTRPQYPASSRNILSTSSSILPSSGDPFGRNLEMNCCGVAAMIGALAILLPVDLDLRADISSVSLAISADISSTLHSPYSEISAAGRSRSKRAEWSDFAASESGTPSAMTAAVEGRSEATARMSAMMHSLPGFPSAYPSASSMIPADIRCSSSSLTESQALS